MMFRRASFQAVGVLAAATLGGRLASASVSSSSCAGDPPSLDITRLKEVEKSRFMDLHRAIAIKNLVGTPTYVYDEQALINQAEKALAFPNSYGLTVRFAMKSCPNAAIIQTFHRQGIHFDASSGYEVERAIKAGIPPSNISLSSQELPHNFESLVKLGIHFNACSLHQLETFGSLFPGKACGVRFNPGKGSGGMNYKTNVGGPASSFGIWHELKDEVKKVAAKYDINIVRIHTHIGSGSDPAVWQNVALVSIDLVKEFPNVVTLNLGGGYKVGRMSYEKNTDLIEIGRPVQNAFEEFAAQSGRKLKLEIEPGTFLVANCGALLTSVEDIVSTKKPSNSSGKDVDPGHVFVKLNSGMTEVLRPSLYGAQHPIVHLGSSDKNNSISSSSNNSDNSKNCHIVVGHCCESGDLFTCAPGEPETLMSRQLLPTVTDRSTTPSINSVKIGDLVTIEGAGAYCSSMSTKNYNSFPEAPEVMIDVNGLIHVIRRKQTLDQILQNEVPFHSNNKWRK